ncbi:helix-turn-helix domain-containing protein [Nocardioides dongxiaopingii]|uniref:helix-turn-helix domain-containing protein n=1 Tax=Nocardioides dongxiaopingii TaxID=2576036 RepID=UPI0010C76601|nr:helix-turn-helix domain-containing protein [Nocardioides dongxiaopingii]
MIVGRGGPAVVLSAETAYFLETFCKHEVSRLRVRTRGLHQRVAEELLELRRVAMEFDPQALPGDAAVGSDLAEVGPEWISVAVAADLLGMGDRGVRLACQQDRLDARQVGGRWQISREALEQFKTARAA